MAMRASWDSGKYSKILPGSRQVIQESINEIRQVKGYERHADYLQKMLDGGRFLGKVYTAENMREAEYDPSNNLIYLNKDISRSDQTKSSRINARVNTRNYPYDGR